MPGRVNRGGSFEKWTVRLVVPAIFLALFIAMFSIAGSRVDWRGWFDGPERGTWRAVTIDGLDVRENRMHVIVADGEIRGGRDGCNYWGYSGEPDPETGERMIETTLAGCVDSPEIRAYNTIGHHLAELRLEGEDRLIVSNQGVTGNFIRWTDAMEEAEREADEREMEEARRNMPPSLPVQTVPPPAMVPPPPVPPPSDKVLPGVPPPDEVAPRLPSQE